LTPQNEGGKESVTAAEKDKTPIQKPKACEPPAYNVIVVCIFRTHLMQKNGGSQ